MKQVEAVHVKKHKRYPQALQQVVPNTIHSSRMKETEQITTASGTFEGHKGWVSAVAVFPDRRRMVTALYDKTVRLWDLKDGVELERMEGHSFGVQRVAVSRDGQFIAGGDSGGALIAWNRDGKSLTGPIKIHTEGIWSLDFSPDGAVLASGSDDTTTRLWNTKTWQVQGKPIKCGIEIVCVRYSPSGEYLAIATWYNIQIWNPGTRKCIAKFDGHSAFNGACNISLVWTPDGKQLISGGSDRDPTIRIWDSSTWKWVGKPWKGHNGVVWMIALNPAGTLLVSTSADHQVRLWRLSDQRNIAIFKHTNRMLCATFSTDGKHILSGGSGRVISKWAVPLPEDILQDHASHASSVHFRPFFISFSSRMCYRRIPRRNKWQIMWVPILGPSSCILILNLDAKPQQADCDACFQSSLLPHHLIMRDTDPHHQHDSLRCMHKWRLAHC
jgi:WD40 repeat protein